MFVFYFVHREKFLGLSSDFLFRDIRRCMETRKFRKKNFFHQFLLNFNGKEAILPIKIEEID